QRLSLPLGHPPLGPPRQVELHLAVHPMDPLVVPTVPQRPQPVVALPESREQAVSQHGIERRDQLAIAHPALHPRPVVRRPRQPGYLASANDRQSMFLDHDADRPALGRRRQSFRLRTSLIAVFSNAKSAYIRLSLAFSASNSRSTLSSAIPAPAYFDFQW